MPRAINRDAIRELAELLDETGLTEIEYDAGSLRIRVARAPAPVVATAAVPAATPAPAQTAAPAEAPAAPVDTTHPGAVTSPMVGTIYLAPEPGAANFIAQGDTVAAGQTLMLVEAMKTFNEIKAPQAGVVREIRVENGAPVEYGDLLAIIE